LIAKCRQERATDNSGNKGFNPKRQSILYDVGKAVDFDDIIDCAVIIHDINPTDTEKDPKEAASSDDTLLAYMSGRNGNNKSGDIHNVRAAKRSSLKGPHKTVECDSAPSSVQVGDKT
jgi:flagellar basal body L-ring protein FlgH